MNKKLTILTLMIIALMGGAMAQKLAMDNASNLYGYKAADGSWKIAPKYQYAYAFKGGDMKYAVVKYDETWGCIDVDGNMMIRNVFPTREAAEEAGAAWKENDELGKWIYPIRNKVDGLWGFVNYFGRWQIEPQFENAKPYSGTKPRACARVKLNGRWGCIDGKGIMVIRNIFLNENDADEAAWQWIAGTSFSTWRMSTTNPNEPDVWGYVNYLGNWEIAPQYSDCCQFSDTRKYLYTQAKQAGRWGNIDRQGKIISDFIFETQADAAYALNQLEHNRNINDWRFPICDPIAHCWGFVDYKGEWVIHPKYEAVSHYINDTGMYATAKKDGYWGAIDNNGGNISRHVFTLSSEAAQAGDQWDRDVELGHWLFPVMNPTTHRWGYVDYEGEWVIQPVFEDAKGFINTWNNRVAPVKTDDRWGCIDHTGQLVVKNLYNSSSEAYIAGRKWGEKHKF